MRSRNWSIRVKILALVAVPLAALLALWAFATTITAGPALHLLSAQTLLDTVGNPGEVLMGEIQRERRVSVQFLADPRAAPAALDAQRAATDRAAAEFRRTADGDKARRAAGATLESRIRQVFTDLEALTAARDYIDRREVDLVGAQNLYNAIVDSGFQMFAATANFGDETVDREIRALITVGRGQEYLSRIDSLLAGAHAAGKLSEQSRAELVQAIGTVRFLFAQGVGDLPERDRVAFQRLSGGAAFNRLQEFQNQLVAVARADTPPPVSAAAWQSAYDTTAQQLRAFEINATDSLAEQARPVAANVLVRLGIAGLLGLAALIATIVVSVRVGRSIVGRLGRLRREALEMASERLPAVVRRLQRGEAVDVDAETPSLEYGRDEIGQLGRAFNEVRRTAVQSAVEEAAVRRGINEVFLNIARRSQTLLHRQLALLDKMERRETEPSELEDLYRVDHLATRMRRHAEDLVILAGAAPGRGWRNPVSMIDVVRGAISEVEDYKRVHIASIEPSAVLGRAVGDVIHLLAELLENATAFSPPQTRVEVVGQILPNGYALEIEDRGLGMSADAIAEVNRKLLEPPDFDPSNSARLGHFVVAQLAARQGLRVSLRPSAYGGVTAIVLIPGELVTAALPGPIALPGPLAGPAALPQGSPADPVTAANAWDRPRPEENEDGAAPLHGSPVPQPAARTEAHPMTGPTPSAVVEGLSVDGLVRRRRTVPRRDTDEPAAPAAHLPPNLTSPAGLTGPPAPSDATAQLPLVAGDGLDVDWPSGGDQRNGHGGDPAGLRHGEGPALLPGTPHIPAQRGPSEPVSPEPAPTDQERRLPQRVRQASLAPQLREPAAERAESTTVRSPEQVRSLMSALQRGTTRGRREAAALIAGSAGGEPPEAAVSEAIAAGSERSADEGDQSLAGTDKQRTAGRPRWSEAATVTFPAVPGDVDGSDGTADGTPDEKHQNHRPDKDT
ncbi:nitrate- and nitrite sensing domain-containing protein [Actinoplanes sp. NPDC051346]|uniref:sensor histidine kinase n=1 Tax=Actinoplanes sp. NPDC051346 TaxID=3155048 RepID=UPI0034208098